MSFVSTRGIPPFVPTADERKLVETLAAKGLRYVDIASVLRCGINDSMLAPFIATSKWTSKTYGEPT